MLENLHVPPHVISEDTHPEIPVEQKLAEIAAAKLAVEPVLAPTLHIPIVENQYRAYLCDTFRKQVPYVKGMRFVLNEKNDRTTMEIEWLDLGNRELYGHGIGTKLLRQAVEYGLEAKDNLTTLTISPANIALIKTIGKVVGEDHVAFRRDSTWYGEGHEKPLRAITDDIPYNKGDRYLMHEVRATIDPETVRRLGEQAVQSEVA